MSVNFPERTRNFEKSSFLKLGTGHKSAALSLLKRSAFVASFVLPT